MPRRARGGTRAAVVLATLIAGLAPAVAPGARATSVQEPPAANPEPAASPDRSLSFEANAGQFDPKVRFLARGPGYTLFLSSDEAVFDLVSAPDATAESAARETAPDDGEVRSGAVVRMRLTGANPEPVVEGKEQLEARTNYFIGNDPAKWHTQVPSYARVVYRGVYPGIDMVWREGGGNLEYDFVVSPGADPSVVAVTYEGAESVSIVDGDLVVRTAAGDLRQHKPITYQDIDGARRLVDSGFVANQDGGVGFDIGSYDDDQPLVIDPEVIYSTYLGGVAVDDVNAVAADRFGNTYLTGSTQDVVTFPVTAGAYQSGDKNLTGSRTSAFLVKLAPGGAMVFGAYLGSPGNSARGLEIAVDSSNGYAYVTGDGNLPIKNGFRSTTDSGEVFVAVINDDGSQLMYSTYIGGGFAGGSAAYERGGIAVDTGGNAYVTGMRRGPLTAGSYQAAGASDDIFVVKLNPFKSGAASLLYGATFGGNYNDWADDIVVDSAGNAYISGITGRDGPLPDLSTPNSFPVTAGPFGARAGKSVDIFTVKLNAEGTGVLFSTYLGSSGGESLLTSTTGITIDAGGSIYVTGNTTAPSYPVTDNAYQKTKSGGTDLVLSQLDPAREGEEVLVYSTYLGGTGAEDGSSIVTSHGVVHLVGTTTSSDFPTKDAFDSEYGGGTDVFLASIDLAKDPTNALVLSSLFGGAGSENNPDLAMDTVGNLYLSFPTSSAGLSTTEAQQPSYQGGAADGFAVKIGDRNLLGEPALATGPPLVNSLDPTTGPTSGGTSVTIRGKNLNAQSVVVRFGDAIAEKVTIVEDRIAAISPRHAEGPVDVTVETEFGESAPSESSRFGYIPSAVPTVTYAAPSSVAAGDVVTIRGTGLDRSSLVHLGDVPATSTERVDLRSDTELRAVVPPQPAGSAVNVSVTTAAGTSAPSAASRLKYAPGRWEAAPTMRTCRPGSASCIGRAYHTSTLLQNGTVLVIGGVKESGLSFYGSPSAQLYDPAAQAWRRTGSMRVGRRDHTATMLADGRVFVAGGQAYECDGGSEPDDAVCARLESDGAHRSAEIYDPQTGRWTDTGSMVFARLGHTATLLSGDLSQCGADCNKVLVTGGSKDEGTRGREEASYSELYDPVAGTWASVALQLTPRTNHTATLLRNGKVLIAGGLSTLTETHALASAELYDPLTRQWAATGAMAERRFAHTATALFQSPCGTLCDSVLVAGGITGNIEPDGGQDVVATAGSELYDPATGLWGAAGLMNEQRSGHTATQLTDGTVLVAGRGSPFPGQFLDPAASAEVFDPRTATWRETSSMREARGSHTATMLNDASCAVASSPRYCGKVILTGGVVDKEAGTTPRHSAEVYTSVPLLTTVTSTTSVTASGPAIGGTEVKISGANFRNVTNVALETVTTRKSVSIPFSVQSPTSMSVTTPPHDKGPVHVLVTNDGGISSRSALFVYVGLPGKVAELRPIRASDTRVDISFDSPDDGTTLAKATQYLIKQSTSPIADEASFEAARSLCPETVCTFKLAHEITLSVNDLEPSTQYFYAVKALNALGEAGEMTAASAITLPPADTGATSCPALPEAVVGQIPLAGGRYSLVGFPEGTVMGAGALLYGWFDRGAGGTYGLHPAEGPLRPGRGYWAWSACPRLIDIGAGAPSVNFPLGAYHASMVGNPSGTSPSSVSGHDFAARWDPGANAGAGGYRLSGYREPLSLAVGEGVWLFTYVPTDIHLQATG